MFISIFCDHSPDIYGPHYVICISLIYIFENIFENSLLFVDVKNFIVFRSKSVISRTSDLNNFSDW